MPSIMFRPATILDAPDLLRWKNDPEVRSWALATHDEITEVRHAAWMKSMLANPDMRTYIVEYNGIPCGDVRAEIHSSFVEMAIKLDSRFRQIGIGATALTVIGDLIQKEFKKPLVARIVYGNVASMRLFQKCGYRVRSRGEGYYRCLKDYTPTSE